MSLFKLFGNLTLLGLLGIPGDVGRLAAAVGIDIKDAFSLFEHFNPGQALPQRARRISCGQWDQPTLAMVPALAALLDEGIARGEGGLDVAAAVRVPG